LKPSENCKEEIKRSKGEVNQKPMECEGGGDKDIVHLGYCSVFQEVTEEKMAG